MANDPKPQLTAVSNTPRIDPTIRGQRETVRTAGSDSDNVLKTRDSSGTRLCNSVPPSPRRPDVFDPQANRRPSHVAANVCAVPPEIEMTPVNRRHNDGPRLVGGPAVPKLTVRRQAPAIDQALRGREQCVCAASAQHS